ncbi:FAD-dependent oxidoreductase [Lentzea sp. NPDC051838]|uniref:NAD(P)/FAD-dependent oxidoreductase n=1 Tax=Lentzea sp. NPDC051838 TaxID=3154849 RepID=UPI00343418AF
MNRVVVVGASVGGFATAEALRGLGFRGRITLIGEEAYLPYDRPPLSKQVLTGEFAPHEVLLRPAERMDALELELELGVAATGLDVESRVLRVANGPVLYDALVVATGVRPHPFPGAEGVRGVHFVRTLEDALALKENLRPGRRLVVVGAGFVGAEVAAVARGLGVEVTVFEPEETPMGRVLGPVVGATLADVHRARGVDLRTGVVVREVLSFGGQVLGVQLMDGTEVPADVVVVAIGCTPNVEWLRDSGLRLSDGLSCDEFCEAAPGVYGVGDVARWHNPLFGYSMRVEHRTNAAEQAFAVARNLVDPEARQPFAPVPYFWSDQYDLKIQSYGHLRDHDEVVVVEGDLRSRRFVAAYRKGDHLAAVVAVNANPKTLRSWRAALAARQQWQDIAA